MNLEERVRKLERSARVWRTAAFGVAAIALVSGLQSRDPAVEAAIADQFRAKEVFADVVACRRLIVDADAGISVGSADGVLVSIGRGESGHGMITIKSSRGGKLVTLGSIADGMTEKVAGVVAAHDPEAVRPAAMLQP